MRNNSILCLLLSATVILGSLNCGSEAESAQNSVINKITHLITCGAEHYSETGQEKATVDQAVADFKQNKEQKLREDLGKSCKENDLKVITAGLDCGLQVCKAMPNYPGKKLEFGITFLGKATQKKCLDVENKLSSDCEALYKNLLLILGL